MKSRPKIALLDAHLAVRRRLASARREAHAVGHVVNLMLEIEREVARLDAKILELEETIARLSDDHQPQRQRFKFRSLKVDLVISDKKQLRELVAVLSTWRGLLANEEGRRAIGAARMLSDFLTDGNKVDDGCDEPPPTNAEAPPEGTNGSAAKSRRWG